MSRLSVFGKLDLRTDEGGEVRQVLAQPKRLAVLVYLVVEGRFVQRDELQALFWPESDAQRARQSLNRTVYFLRQALGESTLVSRGSELGVDAALLTSDVSDFLAADEAHRLKDVLDAYQGELCPGFHAGSDLVDFDLWLEARRDDFRRRARKAAESLCQSSAQTGDYEQAVGWARTAVAADPLHEASVRTLMRLLADSGNRGRALETYAQLADRLAQTLGVEPDPDTAALARKLASRDDSHASSGPPGPSPLASSPGTGAGLAATHRPTPASGGARDAEPLAVPPSSLRSGTLRGIAVLAVLAGVVWAGWTALGTDGGDDQRPAVELPPPPGFGGRVPTRDPEAFEAFRRGQEAFNRGRFHEAIDDYRTAITEDPDLAPAYVRLSMAANEGGDYDLAKWAADQGVARSSQMGRYDSLFAVGWHHHLNVRPREAMTAYEAILADTLDPDALANLADVRFHWGPTFGVSTLSTVPLWRQVLTLRDGQVGALSHLIRLEAAIRDTLGLAASLQSLEAAAPDPEERIEAEALAAAAQGSPQRGRALAADFRDLPPERRWGLTLTLGVFAPAGPAKDSLMQALAQGPEDGSAPTVLRAGALAREKGWATADRYLQQGLDGFPERRVEVRVGLAVASGDVVPGDTLSSLFSQLLATDPNPFIGAMDDVHDGIYPPRRLLLLTVLARRAGLPEAALHHREQLERYEPRTTVDGLRAEEYRTVADAFLALEAGDAQRALRTLGSPQAPADALLGGVLTFSRGLSRWVRADALARLGRVEEAQAWFRTFPDPAGYDLAFVAPARARLEVLGGGDVSPASRTAPSPPAW